MIEPSFLVQTKTRTYPVFVDAGLLGKSNNLVEEETDRIFIISDEVVSNVYLQSIMDALSHVDLEAVPLILPPGEETKTLEYAQRIYQFLAEHLASRTDAIFALGGGVIGDLGGFAASTFKRGMRLIQIPTTLLAQVDSSLGGKTAVNLKWGKNLVGTFYQPHGIIADLDTLKSLPLTQYRAGLSEVIKYGVIMDADLLVLLRENIDAILDRDLTLLRTLVTRCLKHKARVIEQDEHETGYRKILNFGHTVGHAIETNSEPYISHGEAIAIGMIAEARYASKLGVLSGQSLDSLETLISDFGLPTTIPVSINREDIEEVMKQDKKMRHGKLTFPLLLELGRVELRAIDKISI